MNKRILASISLFFILIGTCFGASSTTDLYLKAYKYRLDTPNTTNLYVIDSITTDREPGHYEANLGDLRGRELDITSDIEDLLGNPNSSGTAVFAYRVESNEKGPFKLMITFHGPFKNGTSAIGFDARLYNTASEPTDSNIKKNEAESNMGPIHVEASSGDETLINAWDVDNNYSQNNGKWVARGSISMAIYESDYESDAAAYGEYKTTVTVSLQYNG